jgi:hypothetical protein
LNCKGRQFVNHFRREGIDLTLLFFMAFNIYRERVAHLLSQDQIILLCLVYNIFDCMFNIYTVKLVCVYQLLIQVQRLCRSYCKVLNFPLLFSCY